MLRIDSIKLENTTDVIKDINWNYFINVKSFNDHTGEIQVESVLKKEYKNFGIKRIFIQNDKVVIELSSKILKSNYFNLINKDNIEQVVEFLNSKAITFDKYRLLESIVRTVDITNNVRINGIIKDYITDMLLYMMSDKYTAKTYKYETIEFKKNVKTKRHKEQIKAYNKLIEMHATEDKRKILNFINIREFENILRFESRLTTQYQMRKQFNISKKKNNKRVKLKEILESSSQVNYNIFNRILKTVPKVEKIVLSTPKQLKSFTYYNYLKDKYKTSDRVKAYLKKINKERNYYYEYKKFKEYTAGNFIKESELINEVKEKLQLAK